MLALALVFGAAQPAIIIVNHSGRLLAANDLPVTSAVTLAVALHTTATQTTEDQIVWTDAYAAVPLDKDGVYTLALGDTSAAAGGHATLGAELFAVNLWLSVSVNGELLSPWLHLGTVPNAAYANAAGTAAALTDASGDTVTLDASGKIPATALEIPANLATVDASGKLLAAELPDGLLGSTYGNAVAFTNAANTYAGHFAGDGSALTGLAWSQLPQPAPESSLPQTLADAYTFTSNASSFAGTFAGKVSGEIVVPAAATQPLVCDASASGATWFDTGTSQLDVCVSGTWSPAAGAISNDVDLTSAQAISGAKTFAQPVGVGTASPAPSALLDLTSTTQGLLLPRLSSAQRSSIAAPADGLVVYDTTASALAYAHGGAWYALQGTCSWGGIATASPTNVCPGGTVGLSLASSTGAIQWQSSPDGATWSNVAGATAATYTTGPLAAATSFRAVVTNGACASAASTVAPVTVGGGAAGGAATASPASVANGGSSTLTLAGSTGTIQWQSSPDQSTWTNLSGATNATYVASGVSSTTYYRAQVTTLCGTGSSTTATVTVIPDAPGLASANGCSAQTFNGYTVGWVFTNSASVTVTQLGWWDNSGTGLNSSHTVALFTTGGTVLTQATVAAGTANPLSAGYRYQSITPYVLAAGTYVIGGTSGTSDPFLDYCGGTTMAGAIAYSQGRYVSGTALAYPGTAADRGVSYFGPNFLFH